MNLGLEEHVYKYYIHHGVSIYLVASKDICNPEFWQVTIKNLYSPGKDLGFGSCPNNFNNCYSLGCRNNYCICKKPNPRRPTLCNKSQIEQKIPNINTGIDRSSFMRMTMSELQHLIDRLETGNNIDLKQGNIILY